METISDIVIPFRVWFTLTGSCNNLCIWCYRKGSEIATFLKKETIEKIGKSLSSHGTKRCSITGGEPTLHPEFNQIIEILTKELAFSQCSLVTNGRVFHKDVPQSIIDNPKLTITVSLHGANPSHYASNTGIKEGYSQAMKGIENLIQKNVRCHVSVVLGEENLNHLEAFIKTIAGKRIEILGFTIALPSIDDPSYKNNPINVSKKIRDIILMSEAYSQKICFIFSLPWCMLEQELLTKLLSSTSIMFNCPVPEGRAIVVKENGALALCTHTSGIEIANTEESMHIFDNHQFVDFWNSSGIIELREQVDVYRDERCISCTYQDVCRGGCPLWWKFYDFHHSIKTINS